MKKKNIFSKLRNLVSVQAIPNGLIFHWSRKDIGFGQLTLAVTHEGKLAVDDECMDDKFSLSIIKQAFNEKAKPYGAPRPKKGKRI